ncbi:2OG-Fe(II) oxygenase family protein [Litoricolaceae bacterium]|nr:2OG-Fe(II) oxygenase family protein [Litorivicinaceae bacterium]
MNVEQYTPFTDPVFKIEDETLLALNDKLVIDIKNWRLESEGVNKSNSHGAWHSTYDLQRRPQQSFKQFWERIVYIVGELVKKINPEFDLKNYAAVSQAWANVSPKHSFNAPHRHPGFTLSGVYYVAIPEEINTKNKEGVIQFTDISCRQMISAKELFKPFGATSFGVMPKPGRLLLFPSDLLHWVTPHSSEHDRISIAFNIGFRSHEEVNSFK